MSPIIEFSQDDLLRGKVVTPSWYRVHIGRYEEKLSSGGDSTNYVFKDSKILFNADDGSTDFKDVPVDVRFNSKAKGFMIGFFSAITGEDVKPGQRFNLADAAEKEIDIFIENDTYEGRIVNRINGKFRTPRAA